MPRPVQRGLIVVSRIAILCLSFVVPRVIVTTVLPREGWSGHLSTEPRIAVVSDPRPFDSWAQRHEDVILRNALRTLSKGFYIDVGANDPFSISVTSHFYQEGWHGLNIEPLQREFGELQKHRPRDINVNAACGEAPGILHLVQAGVMSKIVKGAVPNTAPVQVWRLSDLWDKHIPKEEQVHFCKIDVEGFERQVLLGINWTRHRPWTFCIEATLPGRGVPSWGPWEPILLENGYKLGFYHAINRFYYDAVNHPELAETWDPMPVLLRRWTIRRPGRPQTGRR